MHVADDNVMYDDSMEVCETNSQHPGEDARIISTNEKPNSEL